ncbi:MAG: cytochrome c family protein, partial [Candidatus Marinimicrobia bacterium]|nr:cytochrome c family protein [Candidatus Neomarinimicrobiota bacterium]
MKVNPTLKQSFLVCILLMTTLLAQSKPPTTLTFDHDLHVNEEDVECLDCHPSDRVESSQITSERLLPDEEACMECHDDWQDEGTCENCHAGAQPYLLRVLAPSNFIFSHQRHLNLEDLGCEVCHGDMAGIDNLPPTPEMADCMSCHLDQQGSTSCQDCHASNFVLRPVDHSSEWLHDHDIAALTESSDCLQCHVQITCDNCHSGSNLGSDESKYLDPVSIYRRDLAGDKQLIDRVHDLNYTYFHGIDADTKFYDCSTCHEVQTFCVDCHQNETDLLRNKPQFHGGLDWGAVKYPNGTDFSNNVDGGAHAELARMDIER